MRYTAASHKEVTIPKRNNDFIAVDFGRLSRIYIDTEKDRKPPTTYWKVYISPVSKAHN